MTKLKVLDVEDINEVEAESFQIDWDGIAAQVRQRNGGWVKLPEVVNYAYAYQIRIGKLKAFRPAGEFDAVCRRCNKLVKGKGELMIRWVGPQ